ncbi:MAG TPA: OsmC family protein [Ktedonobacterales bacterium]
MAHALSARVALIEGDRFAALTGSGGVADLAPADEDGQATGAISPMEALLVALVGCLGMAVAPILRKSRQPVTGYEVRASGVLTTRPPRVFETITVEHTFIGEGLDPRVIERAVTLAEERYCGASAMLGKSARIHHHISIAERGPIQEGSHGA